MGVALTVTVPPSLPPCSQGHPGSHNDVSICRLDFMVHKVRTDKLYTNWTFPLYTGVGDEQARACLGAGGRLHMCSRHLFFLNASVGRRHRRCRHHLHTLTCTRPAAW